MKIRSNLKLPSLTRALQGLFGSNKPISTRKRHPIAYFRQVYLSKPMYEGLEFIAEVERKSRVGMANEIFERGIKSYFGEKLGKYIEDDIEARKHGARATVTRFVRELRKLAKVKGYDISKYL